MNNVRVNGKHLILNKKKIYIYMVFDQFSEKEEKIYEKNRKRKDKK